MARDKDDMHQDTSAAIRRSMTSIPGKSSTALDRGVVDRGGPEKAVTTARLYGKGSNEATYAAMKRNKLEPTEESDSSDCPAPRGKSERGPGGFE